MELLLLSLLGIFLGIIPAIISDKFRYDNWEIIYEQYCYWDTNNGVKGGTRTLYRHKDYKSLYKSRDYHSDFDYLYRHPNYKLFNSRIKLIKKYYEQDI